jgi:hypothetical protein
MLQLSDVHTNLSLALSSSLSLRATSTSPPRSVVLQAAQDSMIVSMALAAGVTWLLYDMILTFPEEVCQPI